MQPKKSRYTHLYLKDGMENGYDFWKDGLLSGCVVMRPNWFAGDHLNFHVLFASISSSTPTHSQLTILTPLCQTSSGWNVSLRFIETWCYSFLHVPIQIFSFMKEDEIHSAN